MANLTDDQWRKRLVENFTVDGLVGGNLRMVGSAEDRMKAWVAENLPGQNLLLESFMGFFLETLSMTDRNIVENGWPKHCPNYPIAFVYFCNLFRRFRACELLFESGYPLDAYSLIRDVKDRAFLIAAVAHNWCTFSKGMGAIAQPTSDPEYEKKSTRTRKEVEQENSNRLIGKASGLATDVQEDMKRWDSFFNFEVHGGALSFTREMYELVTDRRKPEIGPTSKFDAYAMYMNRSAEIAWLVVRLLPFLQRIEGDFGQGWQRKRLILDDSLRYMVQQLGNLGKRIGDSFIAMVDTNFTFRQQFCYFEADGGPPALKGIAGIDSRKKFDNALNSLMTETCRVWEHWNLLVGINESFEKYQDEFNQSGQFWRIVDRSLQDVVVIRLATLLDSGKDVVSMPNILRIIKDHVSASNSALGIGIPDFDQKALDSDIRSVSKSDARIAKILNLRNKFLAHRDTGIVANHALPLLPNLLNKEIDDVMDLLYDLASRYCRLYGLAPTIRPFPGDDDYKRMLELLKAGLAAN